MRSPAQHEPNTLTQMLRDHVSFNEQTFYFFTVASLRKLWSTPGSAVHATLRMWLYEMNRKGVLQYFSQQERFYVKTHTFHLFTVSNPLSINDVLSVGRIITLPPHLLNATPTDQENEQPQPVAPNESGAASEKEVPATQEVQLIDQPFDAASQKALKAVIGFLCERVTSIRRKLNQPYNSDVMSVAIGGTNGIEPALRAHGKSLRALQLNMSSMSRIAVITKLHDALTYLDTKLDDVTSVYRTKYVGAPAPVLTHPTIFMMQLLLRQTAWMLVAHSSSDAELKEDILKDAAALNFYSPSLHNRVWLHRLNDIERLAYRSVLVPYKASQHSFVIQTFSVISRLKICSLCASHASKPNWKLSALKRHAFDYLGSFDVADSEWNKMLLILQSELP